MPLFAILALASAGPPTNPNNAAPVPQSRTAPLLGVRYSAATDVSHVSFQSPLVSYGSSLDEIRLPAAPVQPAFLKPSPQGQRSVDANQQEQAVARTFGNEAQQTQNPHDNSQPQIQNNQPVQSPQLLNPNYNQFPQQFPARSSFAGQPRYAGQAANNFPPFQQQYPVPQQQYTPISQYSSPELQFQYSQDYASHTPNANAFLATGPYAAQFAATNLFASEYRGPFSAAPEQPTSQFISPGQYPAVGVQEVAYSSAPLVSRVAFQGPVANYKYGF